MKVICVHADECGNGACIHSYPHLLNRWCEAGSCDIVDAEVHCEPANLLDRIEWYYEERGLVWPRAAWQALGFAASELGEAWDILLERDEEWVRNHPEEKGWDKDGFAEECGDAIMMVLVACKIIGCDPIAALRAKMRRKVANEN